MHIVLVEPQIAGNTGNTIRLCANVGAILHLVEPLGFVISDANLRRAGLDYHDLTDVHIHRSFGACLDALDAVGVHRWYAFTASGSVRHDQVDWTDDDAMVFGREADGLPSSVLAAASTDRLVYLPMRVGNRSLNLANAVAVAAYEAWRRQDFAGATGMAGTAVDDAAVAPWRTSP